MKSKFKAMAKMLGNPELMRFFQKLENIEEPEFHIGDFTFKGKTWIGILIREKEKDKKNESSTKS